MNDKIKSIPNKLMTYLSNIAFCFRLLYRSGKKTVIFILLANTFLAALPFINLYLIKYLTDSIISLLREPADAKTALTEILFLLSALAAAKMISGFLGSHVRKLEELQLENLLTYINLSLMEKTVQIDISYFDLPENFDALTKSRQNAHSLHQIVFMAADFMSASLLFLFNTLLAVKLNLWLCALLFLCLIPKYLQKNQAEKKSYAFEKSQFRQRRYTDYLYSLLFDKPAAKEIRLFNIGDCLIRRYANAHTELTREKNRFVNRLHLLDILAEIPSVFMQIFIKFFTAYRTLSGFCSLGDFTYWSGVFENLESSTTSLFHSLATLNGYQERINDFKRYFAYREPSVASGTRRLNRIDSIEFRHVTFSYPGSDTILKDISFVLSGKEKNMLIGLNGSGKTTIIKLLTRFYEPTSGEIYLNGFPMGDYDLDSLRSRFAAVFQDYNIFSFTIRENIAIGDFSRTGEDLLLKNALYFSGFNHAAYREEENLDLYVNRNFEPDGIELSGGQRQKLAISRAVIRDADLLILDEPTASLDPLSESGILDTFSRLYRDKMLLMISHRLSAALKMDKIIFIDSGEIAGIGSHEQLYQNLEQYRKLFDLQANKYIRN